MQSCDVTGVEHLPNLLNRDSGRLVEREAKRETTMFDFMFSLIFLDVSLLRVPLFW